MQTTAPPLAAQQRTPATAPALAITTQPPGQPPGDMPRIGAWWDAQGGYFAGLARGTDGAPDHLLILCAAKPAEPMAWQAALDWAGGLRMDGHSDWSLPTRAESALLFANVKDQFEPRWHWTSEEFDSSYAWLQTFGNGGQSDDRKSFEGCARAVRRLVLQSFSHS